MRTPPVRSFSVGFYEKWIEIQEHIKKAKLSSTSNTKQPDLRFAAI